MLKQRDEKTMLELIIRIAEEDDRIRAAIMNGSRVSPSAKQDIFQDYDIVYIVTEVESFVKDQTWTAQFGEMLIMQTPDEMDGHWPRSKDRFAFLMQFTDGNRIDLTLLEVKRLSAMPRDSQSILLLDKHNIVPPFDAPSDKDYLPKPPSAKEFANCCNEFLWVSTYVAKGIGRKELTYAKYVAEQIVKEELIKLLIWYAAIRTNHQKVIGKFGKNLQECLEPELWNEFKKTYTDADYENMWQELFKMCEIFNKIASSVAKHYGFSLNQTEYKNVVNYLHEVRAITQ